MKIENKKRLFLLGKVILAIVTSFVLGNLLSVLIELIIPSNSISTPILFLVDGGHHILTGLTFIALFVKVIDREKIITSDWFSSQNRIKEFFVGGLLGCICIFLGFLIIININWSQVEIAPLRLNFLFSSFFMLLCGAFFEELVFRGYVLRKLLERFSPVISLSFCSLIFSLLHCFNDEVTFLSILNIFLAGFLLGILYIKTKNIWLITGFHFLWNYIQALLGFSVSGEGYPSILFLNFENMNSFNGGNFGFEGSYVCSIILLFAICFYYKLLPINRKCQPLTGGLAQAGV